MINHPSKNLRSAMQKRILLFFIFSIPCFLQAQEKSTPPPTKITLPSDTTKAEPTQEKVDVEKPQIELPDVLVIGRDRQVRIAGEKETLRPDSPTLVQPTSPYEPVSKWLLQDTTKFQASRPGAPATKTTWGGIQVGGYTTIIADVGHWQKRNSGTFHASGWFDGSAGEFANTEYSQGGIAAKADYKLAPRLLGSLNGDYSLFTRGLYRTQPAEFERAAKTGKLSAKLLYDTEELSSFGLAFDIGAASLATDTNNVKLNESKDFWYNIAGDVSARSSGAQWIFSGHYLNESFDATDSTNFQTSFGEMGIEIVAPFSKKLIASAGARYQVAKEDTSSQHSRFSPYGKLSLMPSPALAFTFHAITGFEYQTFTEWWRLNPYLAYEIPKPEESDFILKIDGEATLAEGLKIHGSFKRSWMGKYLYWERADSLNVIDLKELIDPRLTEVEFGISAEISKISLDASFISYADKIPGEAPRSQSDRIPYRPDFRVPVRAAFNPTQDVHLSLSGNVFGDRPSSLNGTGRLPSFAVFDVNLSKDFSRNITATATVKNLIDKDYVIWENFPETGIYVLFGLRAKF